jgi:hypothetical protein
VAGCCECGDEPVGSGATELVTSYFKIMNHQVNYLHQVQLIL